MKGSGTLLIEDTLFPFVEADVLFVPAGRHHRFVDFTPDLTTWAIFWGPPGGEESLPTYRRFATNLGLIVLLASRNPSSSVFPRSDRTTVAPAAPTPVIDRGILHEMCPSSLSASSTVASSKTLSWRAMRAAVVSNSAAFLASSSSSERITHRSAECRSRTRSATAPTCFAIVESRRFSSPRSAPGC